MVGVVNMDGGFVDQEQERLLSTSETFAPPLEPFDAFRQLHLLSAIQMALLSAFAFLAAHKSLALSPLVLVVAYASALSPQLVACLEMVRRRVSPPAMAVGVASLVSIITAYIVAVSAVHPGTRTVYGSALFAVAALPYFASVGMWLWRRRAWNDGGIPLRAIGFLSIAHIAAVTLLAVASATDPDWSVSPALTTVLYVAFLAPSIVANWLRATDDERIPKVLGEQPEHDHISGVGALTMIMFISTIVMLGLWAAAAGVGAEISKSTGVIVIIGLAVAFFAVAVSPHLPRSKSLDALGRRAALVVRPVGRVFSYLDSLLVFPIAGAIGVNQTKLWARYALLLGFLTPCAVLGWWLPQPYGLVPCAWAVITTMSVARRWAWVEEDRENAMLNRKFEGEHIKVGFEQDLRDEALLGFMALFLIVPIALRQMYLVMDGTLFGVDPGANINHLWVWLGFFGTELAKAVPFVDWAEIYQVKGAAALHVMENKVGAGQHVIFATRVLVDLVFLAALLQAISISQRTSKLKEMFYVDRTLNRLDPFLELKELRGLVIWKDGEWKEAPGKFDNFPRYDPDRLEELRAKHDGKAVGMVAEFLLERDEGRPDELLLLDECKRKEPDEGRCFKLLDQIERLEAPNISQLKSAHYALVSKSNMRGVRAAITNIIAGNNDHPKVVDALSEIVMGPGAGVADPRAEVRLVALNGLYHPAAEGNQVAKSTIVYAARNDTAKSVKEAAGRFLDTHSTWVSDASVIG